MNQDMGLEVACVRMGVNCLGGLQLLSERRPVNQDVVVSQHCSEDVIIQDMNVRCDEDRECWFCSETRVLAARLMVCLRRRCYRRCHQLPRLRNCYRTRSSGYSDLSVE